MEIIKIPNPMPTLASHLYLKRNKHWALSTAVKWHGQGDLRSKTLGQSRRNEPGLKWEKNRGGFDQTYPPGIRHSRMGNPELNEDVNGKSSMNMGFSISVFMKTQNM